MTSYQSHDPSAASLARLPRLAPDPHRAERVRVRCRARLGRTRRRTERVAVVTGLARRWAAPIVLGGCCVVYVAAFVTTAIRLEIFAR